MTRKDIQLQEQILESMKHAYENQHNMEYEYEDMDMNIQSNDVFLVPICYLQAGDQKVKYLRKENFKLIKVVYLHVKQTFN